MKKLIFKKGRFSKNMELFMSPVLNLFVILIPFLLMTAVFVQTSVIELTLPSKTKGKKVKANEKQTLAKEKLLILSIGPQGFYLILEGKLLKIIPKNDTYEFDKLEDILKKVKQRLPEQKSIIIEADDSIIYDYIIKVMDHCRACGLINISLSASKS